MASKKLIASMAVAMATLSLPAVAHADDSALAQQLFQDGRRLIEAGQPAQACPKFQESLRLEFGLGTLLNLADCEAAAGHTASAWARFGELAEKARLAGQGERASYATKKRDELAAKLTYVSLTFVPKSEIDSLTIDGRELGPAVYTAPIPVDPGSHTLTIQSAGHRYRVELDAKGEGNRPVTVPLDAAHRLADDAPKNEDRPPVTGADESVDGRKIAGWVTLAVGLGGLGVGAFLGVRAMGLKSDSDDQCNPSGCTPDGLADYESGRSFADGATIAFVVSGAVVATGTGILIWAYAVPESDDSASAGFGLSGRF